MADSVNVQAVMQEIRQRIRQRPGGAGLSDGPNYQDSPLAEMCLLEGTVQLLDAGKSLVGETPPQPASLRGKMGKLLVKAVQRMLFWYTPQIRQFQAGVVTGFEQQLAVLRALAAGHEVNGNLLMDVQNGVERLEQALAGERQAREELARRLEAEIARRHPEA